MRAIQSTKQGLQVKEIEKPLPTHNEILVKVRAASVTAGDVVMQSLPAIAFVALQFLGMKRKQTMGHEFAGVVEAVGSGVTQFAVGDAVFGTTTGLRVGATAEYVCLPEDGTIHVVAHKPDSISFEQAAVLPIGAMTALQILQRANIQHGQKVLIYGASGSVGTYAVQLARYFGAEVTGVCSTRNVDLVKSIGANQVIDYKQEDFTQNSVLYDVIFDTVVKLKKADVQQSLAENGTYLSTRTTTKETIDNLQLLAQLASEEQVKPIIDRCYPLQETADAYAYVKNGRKTGNVVIVP